MSKNPAQWAEGTREYLNEVQIEFKKVTWPSQQETVAGTVSVLVIVVILAVVLFGVDSLLAWILGFLIQ